MLKFKEFINLIEQNTVGKHNDFAAATYLPSDFTGSEAAPHFDGRPPFLSSLDVILPSVKKTAEIRILERNKNPIFIMLSDGTKLYLTWNEFKRISGPKPEVGRKLTVIFQRNPDDKSDTPSKINGIFCH